MRLCTFCVLNSLDAETGDRRHLVNVLVLILHSRAHGRVSHHVHDRKQVFGCAIHLRSEAVPRAVRGPDPSAVPPSLWPFQIAC